MTTFHWPRLDRSSWLLAGFIFLSLFLHSAAFFLFQTGNPVRPPAPRPAQPVQLLTPFGPDGKPSPENEALLAWIEAEDPALVARVPEVQPEALLKVEYKPSYRDMRTAPLGVPEESGAAQFPSAREPMALILGHQTLPVPATPTSEPRPTHLMFSNALAPRAPKVSFVPQAKTGKAVEPTRLLIGVNAEGEVRFTFPQQPSSGEPALDAEALQFVSTLRFAPASGTEVAWGFTTFHWGDDAVEDK
jgi:hypothetical protein